MKTVEKDKTPVLASALIKALKARKVITAKIVDEGDLAPRFGGVDVDFDDETKAVSVKSGWYTYAEDSCRSSVDPGWSCVRVCGVAFGKPVLGAEEEAIRIDGEKIEYDNGLTEEDVLEVAGEVISFPSYDADDFSFVVTADTKAEIEESIDEQIPEDAVYLETSDGNILCFEDCKVITRKKALKALFTQARDIDFEPSY